MKSLLTAILLLTALNVIAAPPRDPFSRQKLNHISLRPELGWQKAWFVGLGVSYMRNDLDRPGSPAFIGYIAPEANFSLYNSSINGFGNYPPSLFMGLKSGIEFSYQYISIGAEYRTHTDLKGYWQYIITPKAGLSYNGIFNLHYGYNIIVSHSDYFNIAGHMISLSFNLAP